MRRKRDRLGRWAATPGRRKAGLALCIAVSTIGPACGAHAGKKFTTIDVVSARSTSVAAINKSGEMVGYFFGHAGRLHSFVCSPDGVITTFDAPGGNTYANSINAGGEVAGVSGIYPDFHGFTRDPGGTITSFDVPGAGGLLSVSRINRSGEIAGWYDDSGHIRHGFVRTADGTVVSFDAPGAGTGVFQGTYASDINNEGEIVGGYSDEGSTKHGFFRTPDGTVTPFDIARCHGPVRGRGSTRRGP